MLERRQLLEIIELTVKHVRLGSLLGHALLKRGNEVLLRCQPIDELTRLDQGRIIPAPKELRGHLCLGASPRLPDLLARKHHRTEGANQTKSSDGCCDRRYLLCPIRNS